MLHKCFVILKLAQFYTHYVSASYIFFFHLQFAKIEAAAHSCPRERKHAGAQFLNKVSAVSKKKMPPLPVIVEVLGVFSVNLKYADRQKDHFKNPFWRFGQGN